MQGFELGQLYINILKYSLPDSSLKNATSDTMIIDRHTTQCSNSGDDEILKNQDVNLFNCNKVKIWKEIDSKGPKISPLDSSKTGKAFDITRIWTAPLCFCETWRSKFVI